MALLPARNILDGTALPVTSQMKTALGSLRDYLAGLLGTDSTDPAAARIALGAATRGANADITSLTGLTTALSMAQGGSGSATAFASSLAASGYQKLPSGLIIQWGIVNVANAAANATNSASFPIAFTTAVYSATANMASNSSNGKALGVTITGLTTINLINDPAGVQSGTGAMYIAIGR